MPWVEVLGQTIAQSAELAYAETTAMTATGVGTVVDITGLAITLTPPANRPYMVHLHLPFCYSSVDGSSIFGYIADSSNNALRMVAGSVAKVNGGIQLDVWYRVPALATPTSVTYKGRLGADPGATAASYASNAPGSGLMYFPFIEAVLR
jgi:hypothetical protein